MDRSEQIGDLAAALAKAQGEIKSAMKGKENPFYKSSYADLACVMEACRAPLSKHGLAILQSTQYDGDAKWIETVLAHSSGQWISSRYPVKPVKDDPQGLGSAITYARRYSLMALVGIVAEDEDDDGNAASGKNGNGNHAPPPPRQRAPAPSKEAMDWTNEQEAALRKIGDPKDLDAWEAKHSATLVKLRSIDTGLHGRMMDALADAHGRFNPLAAE